MSPTREEWQAASALFGCLATPLRVGIIALLAEGGRSVGEIVELTGASQPLISQHLKVLRDQCLVTGERDGRRITYRLVDNHVAHIVADALTHTAEHRLPDHED